MREIKFRGQRVDTKSWVYGDFFHTPLTDENSGLPPDAGWYFLTGTAQHSAIRQNGVAFWVHPESIGQFTGLKDKNGKEIYEGDIIDVTGRMDDYEMYAVVDWDADEARWGYSKKDGDDTEVGGLWDLLDPQRNVIIGNIYENPDLLN